MEKGLNFCPDNPVNQFNLFVDLHQFVRKLTLQRYFSIKEKKTIGNSKEITIEKEETPPERSGKFIEIRKKSTFHPVEAQGHFVRTVLECVPEDFKSLDRNNYKKRKNNQTNRFNLSKEEKLALKSLRENMEIVIRQADKGGGVVVQNYEDYNAEAMKILSDMEYYSKISEDPFSNIEKKFVNFIKKACDESVITKEEFKFIHIPFPGKPIFITFRKYINIWNAHQADP